MLEEIKYWDASSWKEFVKNNLVPLRDLGIYLGYELDFPFYMDPLADEALHIGHSAQKAVEIAENIFGEPMGEREISEKEDLLEILREFLEIGANTTAGCSKHTFFVWSTRKITKNYLEEHYPVLKDPERFKKVAEILGWVEYWKPPRSRLLEGYTLYAYPDYCTLFEIQVENPEEFCFYISSPKDAETTLGGLICKLNEQIWFLLSSKPGLTAKYVIPEVFENYREMCQEMLEKSDWIDEYDFIFASELSDLDEIYSELCSSELYEFEGLLVRMYERSEGRYIPLDTIYTFEFWDNIMPPMFLGKYEFVFDSDKSKGVILARW